MKTTLLEGMTPAKFDKHIIGNLLLNVSTPDDVRQEKLLIGIRNEDGEIYRLPLPGGEGRPIRSLMAPAPIPIYVASLGPANLRLTGELADGWIGNSFFPESAEAFFGPIGDGVVIAGGDYAPVARARRPTF